MKYLQYSYPTYAPELPKVLDFKKDAAGIGFSESFSGVGF